MAAAIEILASNGNKILVALRITVQRLFVQPDFARSAGKLQSLRFNKQALRTRINSLR